MPDPWKDIPGKIRVLSSFPPIFSMVKTIGGERVASLCLCTTTGPHEYTFNSKDSILVRKADVFFSNGFDLDNLFVDRLSKDSGNRSLKLIRLANKIPKAKRIASQEHNEDEKGAHAHHHHGAYDPHVWLGIPQAIIMIEGIRDELCLLDPEDAENYKIRSKGLIDSLEQTQKTFQEKFQNRKNKVIVTFHESLGYMASSFGLEIAAVIQKTPGDEPNSPELTKIVKLCLEKKPALIAVEPQYPKTSSARLLQDELKKKGLSIPLVEIDPLETCTVGELSGDWFLKKLAQNLETLEKHLP